MKKNVTVSAFTLERYRLGELRPEDSAAVREALVRDTDTRLALEKLEESDRELRLAYPLESLGLPRTTKRSFAPAQRPARGLPRGLLFAAAAAVLLCLFLPALYITGNFPGLSPGRAPLGIAAGTVSPERAKGRIEERAELSLYLKGGEEILLEEIVLPNQTVLEEGSTVQLAYTTPPGSRRYGVIFSVDGRSQVTMHYPYGKGQSSLLVSGRRTFLDEAYTLDDAPDFEVFVMVVSPEPLDTEAVLREARELKTNIEERSRTAFAGCEVETLKVLKK